MTCKGCRQLPNNYTLAEQRLKLLQKRFEDDKNEY